MMYSHPMLAATVVALLAGALFVAPELASTKDDAASAPDLSVLTNLDTPQLSFGSERTLVTLPGHRYSEYAAATSPIDPNHIVVAGLDWDHDGGSTTACTSYVSRDGGLTWSGGDPGPGFDDTTTQIDPWITVDHQGRAHVACMKYYARDAADTAWVETGIPMQVVQVHARSDDGGGTWNPATRITSDRPDGNVDKLAIHATAAGTLVNAIYDGGLAITTSEDGGDTWLPPFRNGEGGFATSIASHGSSVYVMYSATVDGTSMHRLAVSEDGGRNWGEALKIVERRPFAPPVNDPFGYTKVAANLGYVHAGTASLVAHPSTGNLYYASPSFNDDAGHYKTLVLTSDDQGATWTELAVPDFAGPDCTYCEETFTQLAVNENGVLGLQVRVVESTGIERMVWFTASANDGDTWGEPVLVTETGPTESHAHPRSWLRAGPEQTINRASYIVQNPQNSPELIADSLVVAQRTDHIRYGGDYWAITANADGFVAMWLDHLNGYPQLWARQVTIDTV